MDGIYQLVAKISTPHGGDGARESVDHGFINRRCACGVNSASFMASMSGQVPNNRRISPAAFLRDSPHIRNH